MITVFPLPTHPRTSPYHPPLTQIHTLYSLLLEYKRASKKINKKQTSKNRTKQISRQKEAKKKHDKPMKTQRHTLSHIEETYKNTEVDKQIKKPWHTDTWDITQPLIHGIVKS